VEEQKITTFSLGGEHQLGWSVFDFSLARSTASTKKPDGQLNPEFEQRGIDLNVVGIDTVAPGWSSPTGFDLHDDDNYPLDVLDFRYQTTTSDIDTIAGNFTIPMVWGGDTGELKVGVKHRALTKDRRDDRAQWRWEGDDD